MRRHDKNHFVLFKRGNSKIWYAYYYDDSNQRHFFSTHQKTKAAAQKYCIDLRNNGGFQQLERDVPTFRDYASKFYVEGLCPVIRDHVDAGRHFAKVDISKNHSTVVNKLIPAFGKYRLDDLNADIIKTGLTQIKTKFKLGSKTINGVRAIMVQILNYAMRDKLIFSNSAKEVLTWAEPHNPREAWTREEVIAVFSDREAWKCDRAYYACMLAALTGMRFGEVRALRWDHIRDGWIYIDSAIAEKDGLKSTKSGKARRIPCPPIVNLIPHESETWVFSCDGVNFVSRNAIVNAFNKRREALGIEKTYHGFRHFFNTELIGAEISSEVVRGMIGHESETMTANYLHIENLAANKVQDLQSSIVPLAVNN